MTDNEIQGIIDRTIYGTEMRVVDQLDDSIKAYQAEIEKSINIMRNTIIDLRRETEIINRKLKRNNIS